MNNDIAAPLDENNRKIQALAENYARALEELKQFVVVNGHLKNKEAIKQFDHLENLAEACQREWYDFCINNSH